MSDRVIVLAQGEHVANAGQRDQSCQCGPSCMHRSAWTRRLGRHENRKGRDIELRCISCSLEH